MPSFLNNIRGLMGSSSSNNHAGGGMDQGGSQQPVGRSPGGRGTSSLRHNSSGMTDNDGNGGARASESAGASASGRRLASGARASGTQPGGQQQQPASFAQRSASNRRSGGGDPAQYDDSQYQQQQGQGQYAAGAYGQQPQGGASSSRRNNAPDSPPQPVQRSTSAGSRGASGRRPSGGQQQPGGAGAHSSSHRAEPSFNPPLGAPGPVPAPSSGGPTPNVAAAVASSVHCLNSASDVNARLDTQVEVRVYPCNNNASAAGQNPKKKFTQFTVKPEGVIIQGTNRHRSASNDLGSEYALHVGRKLQRYELSDTRACQLLVTTHAKSFWVVPAPEAFSRHSGTCRLLGDRKHPLAPHTLQVGDFLRVGSVGVVVIETHNGVENRILSEEKIQKIMKDTTSSSGGFLDIGETDGENSDDSSREGRRRQRERDNVDHGDAPVCYMCFDEEDTEENPLITPCKCLGDTRYVHVSCLRKWHTAEADNQICFLSSVDATCSVCKSTFKSDFKLKDGRTMKLFKSSLEPPYVSLLVATKHEMAQRLFNTRFQLSFSTLLKPDGRNATRPLLLGRSSGSDMVLDYRTVSARHASIRFKNGEFVFTDAGSSNGSYLYLRRPVELTASQPVQFRLGRSMISMKVVNKWNRRLLRAVRRTGGSSSNADGTGAGDDHSVGSNEDDVRISDGQGGASRAVPRRTRESIMQGLPAAGTLTQGSPQHLDLLYALAYPRREKDQPGASAAAAGRKKASASNSNLTGSAVTRRAMADIASANAAAPTADGRTGQVPAPVVAPSPGGGAPPPGAAAPRGSSAGLMQPDSVDEETKEEVEEMVESPDSPASAHDDSIAPIEASDDEDGDADDECEDASDAGDEDEDGDVMGGLPPSDTALMEEDAAPPIMMSPTAMTEASGAP